LASILKIIFNMRTKLLLSFFLMLFSLSNWAQIATTTYDFNANSTGWTGNIVRTTATTACGSASMRRNLYSTPRTGNMVSPGLAGNNTGLVTVSYKYKAANWSANTVGTNPWGSFNVQYGFSATGPWTTFATVSQETQNGTCITKTHTFTPPAGTTIFIKWDCFWTNGDYFINFDDVVISQVVDPSSCFGTPTPGNTIASSPSACFGSTVSLSLQNATAGLGITYQWQSSTDGATYTDISGATSSSYTATIAASTWFRCNVTCSGNTSTSNPTQVTTASFSSCYCASSATNSSDTEILNVTLGDLNNTSNCTIPATGLGSILNRYANYSNLTPASISKIVPVSLSVFASSCSATLYSTVFKVFIDGNQDGDYLDAGETVYTSAVSQGGASPAAPTTATINIPATFLDGVTGMRVVLAETTNPESVTPCGTYTYGETEDYIINLTSPPICFTTPAASTTQSTSTSVCSGENYTLSLSNAYTLAGFTFQWQSSPDGATYDNITGANNATYATSQTASTFYRCLINCIYGGSQTISVPVLVSNLSNFNVNETACGSYTWNGTTYTQSGTYTWTGTNAAGCDSVVTLNLTITPLLNFGTLVSGNQTFTGSGNPSVISFSINPVGGVGTFTYQWYSKSGIQAAPTGTATTGWTLITGATSASYDPPVQSASISYAVQVNPTGIPDCGVATWATGVRQITINPAVFTPGVLATGNQTLCNPADPANIAFSTAATTGSTFLWYYQDGLIAAPAATAALTDWTSTATATSSYNPPAGLTLNRTYACRVTNGANSQWASGVRQIIVLPVVNFGTLAAGNQSFTGNGDPANIAFATSPTGGSGAYSYQWYSQAGIIASPAGTATTGWTLISGATSVSYDPPVQSASISYAVQVNPTGIPDCGVATWANGVRQITINPAVFTPGVLATGNQTLCNPADPANIAFSTAATTGSTFQWYFQNGIIAAPVATAALTGWTSISGATSSTFDAPSGLTTSRTYACRVTNGINSQWASGVRQITVLPVFNPGSLIANQTGCNTYDPVSIAMATNPVGSGAYNWRWYYWENTTQLCPTGSTVPAGAVTSATDVRFFGTSTTGSGIFFDPLSSGTNGRTWALLITPATNGAIPACGVAQFSTTCHKTIRQVCRIGQEEVTEEGNIDEPYLGQSYPNPNQGKFNIEYFLPTDCKGEIVIYDITGKKLAQSECKTGGRETLEFDVQHLTQGTYYYSLECNGLKMETRKMILVK
jgi:hypothetical protein